MSTYNWKIEQDFLDKHYKCDGHLIHWLPADQGAGNETEPGEEMPEGTAPPRTNMVSLADFDLIKVTPEYSLEGK